MSSLAARFATQMRKRATSAQGETTLGSGVPSDKRLKRSDLKAVTTIRNMAPQHRELHLRLDDAEKLRYYA